MICVAKVSGPPRGTGFVAVLLSARLTNSRSERRARLEFRVAVLFAPGAPEVPLSTTTVELTVAEVLTTVGGTLVVTDVGSGVTESVKEGVAPLATVPAIWQVITAAAWTQLPKPLLVR